MFGVSLWEMGVVALVALVIVGPQKLPSMLRTVGQWIHRLRQMTTDVRQQTGIDDILQQEGIEGGLTGLRSMMRGDLSAIGRFSDDDIPTRSTITTGVAMDPPAAAPAGTASVDREREYPFEGADAGDVIPDDLLTAESAPDDPLPVSEGPEESDDHE